MIILPKKTIFNLILTMMLLPVTPVFAETVEYDGLIEPYVVVDIGAPSTAAATPPMPSSA